MRSGLPRTVGMSLRLCVGEAAQSDTGTGICACSVALTGQNKNCRTLKVLLFYWKIPELTLSGAPRRCSEKLLASLQNELTDP